MEVNSINLAKVSFDERSCFPFFEVEEFDEPGAKRVVDRRRESSLSFEVNCFSSEISESVRGALDFPLEVEEALPSLETLETFEDCLKEVGNVVRTSDA